LPQRYLGIPHTKIPQTKRREDLIMKTLEEIKNTIAAHRQNLEREYKVKNIGIFGSYVRGEQTDKSDIDILVEFSSPVSLFDHGGLQYYIDKLLEDKTEVVDKTDLREEFKEYILREVIYI